MDDNFESSGRVVESSQFRIAVALYPGASLMNHSCDPSVINSFFGARQVDIQEKKIQMQVFFL